jgi:hypothetical protein
MSPKRVAILIRFFRVIRSRRSEGESWARSAIAGGFSDEPHFRRTCSRALTGLTPQQLEQAVSDSFNEGHVPAPTVLLHGRAT